MTRWKGRLGGCVVDWRVIQPPLGWMAGTEAFEYLLGNQAVSQAAGLRRLLGYHQARDGFEEALAGLQAQLAQDPKAVRGHLMALVGGAKA